LTRGIFPALLACALVAASCAGPVRRGDLKMPYDDRLRLASIYIQSGKPELALPLLEDAAVQDPDRPEAHAMLGEVLFSRGDMQGAARSFALALEAGGEDPLVLNNLAWVEMERGNEEMALNLADRALGQNPVPMYPYLDTRARILQKLGRFEEALADARTALKLTPDHDTRMRDRLKELVAELESMFPVERDLYY
jgi:tetratricopeptide (TPR) repeat protein